MRPPTGKFAPKSCSHCASQTPPRSCPPWSSEARLLDGSLAFVIVMRPSQSQRCHSTVRFPRDPLQTEVLSLSEMFLNPPTHPPSITLSFSPQVCLNALRLSILPSTPPSSCLHSFFFFPPYPQRKSPSFGLCAVMKTETAAGCECQRGAENRLRLSATLCEIAKELWRPLCFVRAKGVPAWK